MASKSDTDNFVQFYRAFKFDLMEDDKLDITTVLPTSPWYNFLFPGRKTVDYLFKNGAVLVGSRALDLYRIDDKPLLNRKPRDWDFEITRNLFDKICYDFDFKHIKEIKDKDYIYWNVIRSLISGSDGYGGRYHNFRHDINLFVKEFENDVVQSKQLKNGWSIPSLEYIISQKHKHCGRCTDLKYIHRRFNHVV